MDNEKSISRRNFLKTAASVTAASMLPLKIVEVCWGAKEEEKFTFACISDAHLTQINGTKFVNNFDKGLKQAVAELGLMWPQPDFVVFGGDLAQLGKKEEIDHGLEILSKIEIPIRFVIGEHDYYLDLGQYWAEKVSKLHYSFDHKGIHFVTLNSILTYEDWIKRWPTPQERMSQMARLDNPQGSPFMVGKEQIEWLKKDLAGSQYRYSADCFLPFSFIQGLQTLEFLDGRCGTGAGGVAAFQEGQRASRACPSDLV